MLFDTHSHIQFKAFDKDRDQVLQRARKAGIEKIIAVGTDLQSSKKAVEIAQIYPEVFASVGIHPHHVFKYCHSGAERSGAIESRSYRAKALQDDITKLEKLLTEQKVVAVGEIGIDKHTYKITKYSNYRVSKQFIKVQKEMFKLQIGLAIKYDKALIIHSREAVEETLEVLEENWNNKLRNRSVFHFCESDERLLDFAVYHNIFIGVDADILTDKNKQEFIKKIPLELLVLETDSPFLTPQSLESPNTPENLKIVLEYVSKLHKIEKQKLEEVIYKNSQKLFAI